ncbi:MAG: helix-turn-helix transcriptional regulator [Jatrophihabitantaceae bacterium]
MAYEFRHTVRQLRETRGWRQAELAKAAAMTRSAVARFEVGERSRACRCWNHSPTQWMPTWSCR